MHALNVGDTVAVSHPRNAFPFAPIGHLDSGDRRIRLVAAGIGITPIITMAEAANRLGLDWSLTYLGRSLESLAFVERVRSLGARAVVHTDGTLAVADIVGDTRPGTALYICGPGPLIEEAVDLTCDADGVEMHFERFTLPPIRDGRPFRVILARSGETIDVPADRTMLDAILDSRPGTVHSCRQGFCGTCRLRVLSGEPEHRDSMLTPNDRAEGAILPCIARAVDDLVIDL